MDFWPEKNTLSSTGENSYSTGSFCEKLNLFNIGTKFQIAHTQGSFEEVKVLTHHSTGPTHIRKFEKTKSPHTTTQRYCENHKVFTNHNGAHTQGNYENLNVLAHYNKGELWKFQSPHTKTQDPHTGGIWKKQSPHTPQHRGAMEISMSSHITTQGAHTRNYYPYRDFLWKTNNLSSTKSVMDRRKKKEVVQYAY